MTIGELLEVPFLRIDRLKISLEDLRSNHQDNSKVGVALNYTNILREEILSIKRKNEGIRKILVSLTKVSDWPLSILTPPKVYVDEIICNEIHSNGTIKKTVKMILFQDSLLIASKNFGLKKTGLARKISVEEDYSSGYKFEMLIRADSFFIAENNSNLENSFQLFLIDSPKLFQSPTDCMEWLKKIREKTNTNSDTVTKSRRHMSQNMRSRSSSLVQKKRSVSLSNQDSPKLSPLRPIQEDKLDIVIKDDLGYQKFYEFLKGEFSEENIEFWKLCEDLKSTEGHVFVTLSNKIIEKYIAPKAPCEINLKSEDRTSIMTKFQNGQICKDSFDASQSEIYSLMERDSFQRFLKSDSYMVYARSKTDK